MGLPPRCSICNGVLHDYGHNAQPVNDGLCCTQCNHAHVIPARLARLQAREHRANRKENDWLSVRGLDQQQREGAIMDQLRTGDVLHGQDASSFRHRCTCSACASLTLMTT